MSSPVLKQFGDLSPRDFADHRVWVACHVEDYDEPWYEGTDEETFRPWSGPLPVERSEDMLLVSAEARLNDGSAMEGFLTPSPEPQDLGAAQPHLFLGDLATGFWGGIAGIPVTLVRTFFDRIERSPEDVFPITFRVHDDLVIGGIDITVPGWVPPPTRSTGRSRFPRMRQ